MDRTLSGATTPDLSGPESDGNKWLLRIFQSSSITGTSQSDRLVSYQDTRWSGEGVLLLQKSCRRILQPLPIDPKK